MARANRHFISGYAWHPTSLETFDRKKQIFRLNFSENNRWAGDLAMQDRHYPSGYVFGYDPTGRCHKGEFLLKFAKDKQRWICRLFEAKKRFGLCVLNFIIYWQNGHGPENYLD